MKSCALGAEQPCQGGGGICLKLHEYFQKSCSYQNLDHKLPQILPIKLFRQQSNDKAQPFAPSSAYALHDNAGAQRTRPETRDRTQRQPCRFYFMHQACTS